MAFDRPGRDTLVFECDYCHTTLELCADEGHPVADTPACLRFAKEVGWTSKKVVGYSWEHYCEECTKLPDAEKRPQAKS
jgi:hypothetical protein